MWLASRPESLRGYEKIGHLVTRRNGENQQPSGNDKGNSGTLHDRRCKSATKGDAVAASVTLATGRFGTPSSTCFSGKRSSVPIKGACSMVARKEISFCSTHNESTSRCCRALNTCCGN